MQLTDASQLKNLGSCPNEQVAAVDARFVRQTVEHGGTQGMEYQERFPAGTRVQIVSREELEQFQREWRLHNPLVTDRLAFGAREAVVAEVGFYHGGEPLYVLADVPGIWHERCLMDSKPDAV